MKLKNKRGFTLIELLAVIVVLAIIALIATPIVMNTIKNAKKGAAERTADNYIKQVETAVAEAKLENKSVPNGVYTIDENGNLGNVYTYDDDLCASEPSDMNCMFGTEQKINVEMNGTKPSRGTLKIENGGVSKEETTLMINNYYVAYKKDKMVATEVSDALSKSLCVYIAGDTPYSFGAQYVCELGDGEKNIFYLLEDGDTTKLTEGRIAQNGEVSLIMNANIDSNGRAITKKLPDDLGLTAWCSKTDYLAAGGTEDDWNEQYTNAGNNNLGPITANKSLEKWTLNWNKITDKTKVTLPTAYQIAVAAGEQFDNTTSYVKNLPSWSVDYLKLNYGELCGYWTSTPYISNDYVETAHDVYYGEFIGYYGITSADHGVRPVITVLKSQLG